MLISDESFKLAETNPISNLKGAEFNDHAADKIRKGGEIGIEQLDSINSVNYYFFSFAFFDFFISDNVNNILRK